MRLWTSLAKDSLLGLESTPARCRCRSRVILGAWSDGRCAVEQFSFFALSSETLSAADISVRLGMESDETWVHTRRIVRRGDEGAETQIQHVVDRLGPIR